MNLLQSLCVHAGADLSDRIATAIREIMARLSICSGGRPHRETSPDWLQGDAMVRLGLARHIRSNYGFF
jgi:hypothetical protein